MTSWTRPAARPAFTGFALVQLLAWSTSTLWTHFGPSHSHLFHFHTNSQALIRSLRSEIEEATHRTLRCEASPTTFDDRYPTTLPSNPLQSLPSMNIELCTSTIVTWVCAQPSALFNLSRSSCHDGIDVFYTDYNFTNTMQC